MNNRQECRCGTDPTNALSVCARFTSVTKLSDFDLLLTGVGPANAGYRLWTSTDLSLPLTSWSLLWSDSFDSSGNFSYTDIDDATANVSRFYRLTVP